MEAKEEVILTSHTFEEILLEFTQTFDKWVDDANLLNVNGDIMVDKSAINPTYYNLIDRYEDIKNIITRVTEFMANNGYRVMTDFESCFTAHLEIQLPEEFLENIMDLNLYKKLSLLCTWIKGICLMIANKFSDYPRQINDLMSAHIPMKTLTHLDKSWIKKYYKTDLSSIIFITDVYPKIFESLTRIEGMIDAQKTFELIESQPFPHDKVQYTSPPVDNSYYDQNEPCYTQSNRNLPMFMVPCRYELKRGCTNDECGFHHENEHCDLIKNGYKCPFHSY